MPTWPTVEEAKHLEGKIIRFKSSWETSRPLVFLVTEVASSLKYRAEGNYGYEGQDDVAVLRCVDASGEESWRNANPNIWEIYEEQP